MMRIVFLSSPVALLLSYYDFSAPAPDAETAKKAFGRTDEPLWAGENERGQQVWLFARRS